MMGVIERPKVSWVKTSISIYRLRLQGGVNAMEEYELVAMISIQVDSFRDCLFLTR